MRKRSQLPALSIAMVILSVLTAPDVGRADYPGDVLDAGSQEPFNKANPDIYYWRILRGTLIDAANGQQQFAAIRGAFVPPQGPFKMFRGTVVAQPSRGELLVNVDNAGGDARLRLYSPIKKKLAAGTRVEFSGVIAACSNEPYVLTLIVDASNLVVK